MTNRQAYTKGPWTVSQPQEWKQAILNSKGILIAEVYKWRNHRAINMSANARLIAAAPEMLEMLKVTLTAIEGADDGLTGQIKRTIDKAEGKQ